MQSKHIHRLTFFARHIPKFVWVIFDAVNECIIQIQFSSRFVRAHRTHTHYIHVINYYLSAPCFQFMLTTQFWPRIHSYVHYYVTYWCLNTIFRNVFTNQYSCLSIAKKNQIYSTAYCTNLRPSGLLLHRKRDRERVHMPNILLFTTFVAVFYLTMTIAQFQHISGQLITRMKSN